MKKRDREITIDHKALVVQEAEKQLIEKGIAFDRITFVTGSNNTAEYDALVYVWAAHEDGMVARTFGINFPEDDETGKESFKRPTRR
jgi:hypothetical protein